MANTAWAINDSTESKNGSPSPIGKLATLHSTIPPTESLFSIAFCNPFSTSISPPMAVMVATIFKGANIFFATTPAATKHRVSRPLK